MTDIANTDFEPVYINENTEVKVPIMAQPISPSDCTSSITISPTPSTTNYCTPIDEYESADLNEYHRLLKLVRDLPSTLFVDRILMDYHQSESDLEKSRLMLFDVIRESEDFPFDINCELKRRITRQGDSAAVKLANDIHTILTAADGGDISCVKELISTGSRRTSRLSSVTKQPIRAHSPSTTHTCACDAEVKILKDTVTSLQADMLLIKQRNAATENIRNTSITGRLGRR